jgi:hypothetical protein
MALARLTIGTCRPSCRALGDQHSNGPTFHRLDANSRGPFGAIVSADQAAAWLRLPSQTPPKEGCVETTPSRSAFATIGARPASAFVWGHRLPEDEIPAKPKLLPAALAFGADVVCVSAHPPFSLWCVLALRALDPWIEPQRQHIEHNREDHKDQDGHNSTHSATRPLPSMRF